VVGAAALYAIAHRWLAEPARWLQWAAAGAAAVALIGTCILYLNRYQTFLVPRYADFRRLGEWLADNTSPDDLIMMEPLGYAGFYSQRRIHDLPGLVAPTVVGYQARYQQAWLIHYVRDFPVQVVILRPQEFNVHLRGVEAEFLDEFHPAYSVETDGLTVYVRQSR
jgi:hypothetical protein